MTTSPLYRARQLFHAVGAIAADGKQTEADAAALARYLSPAQRTIFNAQPAHDRRHSLAVLHTLQRNGETDPDLMTAALLHDIGKSEYDAQGRRTRTVPLWCRMAKVILELLPQGPRTLQRLARRGAKERGWRHCFYLSWEHPRLGTALASQLGASPRTIALIAAHMRRPCAADDKLLTALCKADDMN